MPFWILSLDGGGIRRLVAARMLAAIEKQINQPLIHDASQENITNFIEAVDAYIQQPKIQAALQEFLRISQ